MKVKIEVAEPRGFNGGGVAAVITGELAPELSGSQTIDRDPTILTLVQTPKGDNAKPEPIILYWFVVNCPQVDASGLRFKSLLLTPRYKSKTPPEETLKKGDPVVVNGIWRSDNESWDAASIAAAREGNLEVEGVIVGNVVEFKE